MCLIFGRAYRGVAEKNNKAETGEKAVRRFLPMNADWKRHELQVWTRNSFVPERGEREQCRNSRVAPSNRKKRQQAGAVHDAGASEWAQSFRQVLECGGQSRRFRKATLLSANLRKQDATDKAPPCRSRRRVIELRIPFRPYAMSYDMYFWRQTKDLQMQPEEVVDRLAQDTPLEGVVSFPRTLVRDVFKKAFPDIVDLDFNLNWEGAGSFFQVGFNHATERDVDLIIVNCGHLLLKSEVTMNRILDVCFALGCALYDPQTEQRYEQPEPKIGV